VIPEIEREREGTSDELSARYIGAGLPGVALRLARMATGPQCRAHMPARLAARGISALVAKQKGRGGLVPWGIGLDTGPAVTGAVARMHPAAQHLAAQTAA
jgi:hypothetical protein